MRSDKLPVDLVSLPNLCNLLGAIGLSLYKSQHAQISQTVRAGVVLWVIKAPGSDKEREMHGIK